MPKNVLLGLTLLISACTSPMVAQKAKVTVILADGHRMHFSGKGAGAGMMMSSSMGAMGIAIGVAIDEGIAKEIGQTASESGVDIKAIVADVFESQASGYIEITMEKYGFVTAPSSGNGIADPVVPQLHLTVNRTSSTGTSAIQIPEDLSQTEQCELEQRELSRIKTTGDLITEAFQDAALCTALIYRYSR